MLGVYYAGQPYAGQSGVALNIDLVVADAYHAHTSDSPSLVQANLLVVANAAHAHVASNIDILQQNMLTVSPGLHAHIADNINTILTYTLDIQNALHNHTADNITVTVPGIIAADPSTLGHIADNVNLIQQHILQVQDAIHAQTSTNVGLGVTLVVNDAYHQHIAEQVVIALNARDGSPRVSIVRQKPRMAGISNNARVEVEARHTASRVASQRKPDLVVVSNEQKSRVKKFR